MDDDAIVTHTYSETTDAITVSVTPVYLPDQSDPEEESYAWAYNVQLENNGKEAVQLISRHWKITDAQGITQEVQGPGVVGEQPTLMPGSAFEYTSGTLLPTTSGIMLGSYHMVKESGDGFDVTIPAFSLDVPGAPISRN